jgi:hypothetical protein
MKNSSFFPQPSQQWLWAARYYLFYAKSNIPPGYFSIYGEMHDYIVRLEAQGYVFPDSRVPDISVGKCWCHYLRTVMEENLDNSNAFPSYLHYYPDQRGHKPARLYPNRLRGEFHDWLVQSYFQNKLPDYIKKFSHPHEVAFVRSIVQRLFLANAA